MRLRVGLRPTAEADLAAIAEWIGQDSPQRGMAVTRQLRDACETLGEHPLRGRPRDDLSPGLRMLIVGRRATILHRVGSERVSVVRLLWAGRQLPSTLPPKS